MKLIVAPESRGGSSTEVVTKAKSFRLAHIGNTSRQGVGAMFGRLADDQNLVYLTARVQNYTDLTEARLNAVRVALAAGDGEGVADVARSLTDATAKLGAVSMMRIAIALQMLGRRNLLGEAQRLVQDLEQEFAAFKQTLIPHAG